MDQPVCHNNSIDRLKHLKGRYRLGIDNEISKRILEYDTKGFRIRFLETKIINSSWEEYYILFEFEKYNSSLQYLSYIFKEISKFLQNFQDFNLESGIQEVDCGGSNYYILIYLINYEQEKQN